MIKSILKLIGGIAILLVVIIVFPLLGLWSLNTLFPVLAIPYTWQTWVSFMLLFGSVTGLRFSGSKKHE
jgi:multidrug efflux pump subunit AcrB